MVADMTNCIPAPIATAPNELTRNLERADRLAFLLDARYRFPGTRIHFGWDAIIGLVPLVGDLVTTAISLRLVRYAHQLGASRRCIWQMLGYVAIDLVLGAIPIVGTVFDISYRANLRGLQLLIDDIERRRPLLTAA